MSTSATKTNALIGTTELTLQIHDLTTITAITTHLTQTPTLAPLITRIHITDAEPIDDSNDDPDPNPSLTPQTQRDTATKSKDEISTALTAPITHILTLLTTCNASLQHFSWLSASSCERFTRPPSFWRALWLHSTTLTSLKLDFFEHEVDLVPVPEAPFPGLVALHIDASGAHGDHGGAIDVLLRSCPALRTLRFSWPSCDLAGCQIEKLSWEYELPCLERLSLRGWDAAPGRFAAFLDTCGGVKWFSDGVEGPYEDEDDGPRDVGCTALKALRGVYLGDGRGARSFEAYFSEEAKRPLDYLAVYVRGSRVLTQLRDACCALKRLKRLDLWGHVVDWREPEPDSDDSDGDGGRLHTPPPSLSECLQALLPELGGLEKLGIALESGKFSIRRKNGDEEHPEPMCEADLKRILALLPQSSKIKVLKVWDSRGEALSQGFLDDFPSLPDGMEFLVWEAKKSVVYRLDKTDGKVRAVEYEGEPVWDGVEKGELDIWDDGEILQL